MYPTWEQIFNKPSLSTCTVECPEAWQGDSVLMQVIDRECARLLVNALSDPPATYKEIKRERYASNQR